MMLKSHFIGNFHLWKLLFLSLLQDLLILCETDQGGTESITDIFYSSVGMRQIHVSLC